MKQNVRLRGKWKSNRLVDKVVRVPLIYRHTLLANRPPKSVIFSLESYDDERKKHKTMKGQLVGGRSED